MTRALAILAALCLAGAMAPAEAGPSDRPNRLFDDQPGATRTLFFRHETGGRFQPRALIVVSGGQATTALLPREVFDARSADHIDLSGLPLLGGLFRDRRAPADVEAAGLPVGQLFREGETLILALDPTGQQVVGLPVEVATTLPRDGTVLYRLPRLDWQAGGRAEAAGVPVGQAYLLEGRLILVSDGTRPPVTDWGRTLGIGGSR